MEDIKVSNMEHQDRPPSHYEDEEELQAMGGAVERKISVNDVASIPNGGLRSWLAVAGSFFLFFNTW
jgi:hypothetical protein